MKSIKQMLLEEQILMNTSVSIDANLQEKLKLYQIYSKNILEMKNEKSKLDRLLKKQESPDEMMVKNKSELNKQIIEMNKESKILTDSMAQLIMTTSTHFSYLGYLSETDRGLADEIFIIIVKN